MAADIKFNSSLTPCDPHYKPVLIIGQLRHLNLLKFSNVSCKFNSRVDENTFKNAIACLHPSPTDKCSLYLDCATVAAVPLKCSRHNTPSRSHAITRLVRTHIMHANEENVVIVCDRGHLFASACAVARAFPLYSRKTSGGHNRSENYSQDEVMDNDECYDSVRPIINVEFIIIEKDGQVCEEPVNSTDILCIEEAARGIRLAARIVDMPCNEMNVGHFVKEVEIIAKELCIKPTVIRGEELRERGFGGIYGVGKAAAEPPALVVLSYEPKGAQDTIALVGKGIVYDTGGLSIKGKTAMPGMKRDCGGAAAILGAFYAAIKCGFKENLHAVLCLAENAVGPNATR